MEIFQKVFIKVFMNTNTFEMYSNTNTNTFGIFAKVFEYEYSEKCIRILMNTNTICPGLDVRNKLKETMCIDYTNTCSISCSVHDFN